MLKKLLFGLFGVGAAGAIAMVVYIATGPSHFGKLLPANTLCYMRIENVGTLKNRLLGTDNLLKPEGAQAGIDREYDKALGEMARKLGPVAREDLAALLDATGTVHVAVWAASKPPARIDSRSVKRSWSEPQVVAFFELSSEEPLKGVASKMGTKMPVIQLGSQEAYDLTPESRAGSKVVGYLRGKVFVCGNEQAVLAVIKADENGLSESLADNPRFGQAFSDWAREGDLFAFVDIVGARAAMLADIDERIVQARQLKDEPRRREWESSAADVVKELEGERKSTDERFEAFSEFGHAAIALKADGRYSARVYAADGKEIPKYLQRKSQVHELTRRMPENTIMMSCVGYDGGAETRKSFADFLKEKTGAGVSPLQYGIPVAAAKQIMTGLEQLEKEVVIMAEDYWMAAIPVKSEFAFFVAPNEQGAIGACAAFDWEDKQQVQTLHDKLFALSRRAELPWKTMDFEGLKITYLDLGEMIEKAKKEGGSSKDFEALSKVQLQVGYAIGDTYCFAGSVDLIKMLHKPSGTSLHDTLDYSGLDKENAAIWSFSFGRALRMKSGFEAVDRFMALLAEQIPEKATYTVTATCEASHITLRSNVPYIALGVWVFTEWDSFSKQLEDGELVSGSDGARDSEARAAMGAIRDRARVVYIRTDKVPSFDELGLGEFELDGRYFKRRNYSMTCVGKTLTITCRNVFSSEPRDLVMTANVETGESTFNR